MKPRSLGSVLTPVVCLAAALILLPLPFGERAGVRAAFAVLPQVCTHTTGSATDHDLATKTQCNGLIATPACPTCPGFNPANMVRHAGQRPEINGIASIGIAPFFAGSGPGAMTDNMFGKVNQFNAASGRCGTEALASAGTNALNCGNIHFQPHTQGVVIPEVCFEEVGNRAGRALALFSAADNACSTGSTLSSVRNTSDAFSAFFPFDRDFCSAGADDCLENGVQRTEAHMGFSLLNDFKWAACAAPGPNDPPAPPGCTSATQREFQVMALASIEIGTYNGVAAAGTVNAPGPGDQVFKLTTTWGTTNSQPTTFTPPKISVTQQIIEPEPCLTAIANTSNNCPFPDEVGHDFEQYIGLNPPGGGLPNQPFEFTYNRGILSSVADGSKFPVTISPAGSTGGQNTVP